MDSTRESISINGVVFRARKYETSFWLIEDQPNLRLGDRIECNGISYRILSYRRVFDLTKITVEKEN